MPGMREGSTISGGDIIGTVYENELINSHKILCPPNVYGTVENIRTTGTDGKETFKVDDVVMTVRNESTGKTTDLSLSHFWPVRRPRPIVEKLPGNTVSSRKREGADEYYYATARSATSAMHKPQKTQTPPPRNLSPY